MPRDRKLVVAGLIQDPQGRILLTQRKADQPMPLFWEFPGGKIQPGESPEAALIRELEEELDIQVKVGRIFEVIFHRYPEFDVLLLFYSCTIVSGAITTKEVAQAHFVAPGDLANYSILPADAPLIARLMSQPP